MCSRYWFEESPELRPFVEEMNRSPLLEHFLEAGGIVTSGEVRPTNIAPVVASNRRGERATFPMKWGFSGKTLLINARAETASERPAFREAWAAHRCAVPSLGYFEWEHPVDIDGKKRTGPKYRIRPREGGVTWLCGLYRIENGLPAFVILTREPGEGIRFIHDRMPLMLPDARVGEWIRPDARPEALAQFALTDMDFSLAEA